MFDRSCILRFVAFLISMPTTCGLAPYERYEKMNLEMLGVSIPEYVAGEQPSYGSPVLGERTLC